MKTNKEIIDLLKFHVNKKANEATKMRIKAHKNNDKESELFNLGLYSAFNEVYSMLNNIHLY